MSKCLVLFVEGETEIEFYKQVIVNARKLHPAGRFDTSIEYRSVKGVGGFKSIALRKFTKDIKNKYDNNCEFTVVLCSDTDVFEFASKPPVKWEEIKKELKANGADKIIHVQARKSIEDWFLYDLEGILKFLRLVIKNRIDKSIGGFVSDPMLSDYVKIKMLDEFLHIESKHTRYRETLSIIRNSIEMNQYNHAKNKVLNILEEEEWISPIYCWLLNRLNDFKEMSKFVSVYKGNNPQVLFEISKYYYLNKKYDKALESLKEIPKESETPEFYMLSSLICLNMQKKDDAIKDAERCIELDTSFADAYILLASMIKNEDAEKAVSYLKKAKEIDAENPDIYYELSIISELNEDFLCSAYYLKEYINLSNEESIVIVSCYCAPALQELKKNSDSVVMYKM